MSKMRQLCLAITFLIANWWLIDLNSWLIAILVGLMLVIVTVAIAQFALDNCIINPPLWYMNHSENYCVLKNKNMQKQSINELVKD